MALTEEEKLKKQSKQAMSLDDWYSTSKSRLDQSRQNQLEDAYVNQQLLEKYLPERLAQQGIENTGVAELYRQQANNNYINNRASINQNYNDSLYNLDTSYYTQKKAEQDKIDAEAKERQQALYNMYANKIDSSVNDYGFIDDENNNLLSQYINENLDNLGDYASLLDAQLGMYSGTDSQRNTMYDDNYIMYLNSLPENLDTLNVEEYRNLMDQLEGQRTKIGETNYNNAMHTLQTYYNEKYNESHSKEIRENSQSRLESKYNVKIDTKDTFDIRDWGEPWLEDVKKQINKGEVKEGSIISHNGKKYIFDGSWGLYRVTDDGSYKWWSGFSLSS